MLINTENEGFSTKFIKRKKENKCIKIIVYLAFISLIIFFSFYFFFFKKKLIKNYEIIINQNNKLIKKIENLEKNIYIKNSAYSSNIKNSAYSSNIKNSAYSSKNFTTSATKATETEIFDSKLAKKYIENQHHFCQSDDLFIDRETEEKIRRTRAHLYNISFEMYVYKFWDYVSDSIKGSGSWEYTEMRKLINCLNYYSQKKNLSKKEITILDIGANVGWYSFYLANAGYELYSFEVSRINSYILKKNFCLNENINLTIINKGIGPEEEKCLLHHPSHNIGNAVILCGENSRISRNTKNLTEEIEFTKLSNYYDFLSKKNIALIKLDVEGSEGKVINSGIEFISEYHVPFLFIEFRIDYLKLQGTDPKEFLETFQKNGYLFSTFDFFGKNYLSIEQILKIKSTDLYIIYSKFLE